MLPVIAAIVGQKAVELIVAGIVGIIIGATIKDEIDAKKVEEVKREVEILRREINRRK